MEEWLVDFLNTGTRWLRRMRRRDIPADDAPDAIGTAVAGPEGPPTPVRLEREALDRHLYALGASGSGKSKFLELLVRQHLQTDAGFCLLDPHGDLTGNLLHFFYEEWQRSVTAERPFDLGRVYLVEPFREDAVVGLNPLQPGAGPLYPHIGELVGIFRRFWSSSWGPRMEEALRNTLLALALSELTLTEVAPFLTDAAFRAQTLGRVTDEAVLAYWRLRYDPLSDAARSAVAEPVLNKMGALLADPRVRGMLGQRQGALDLRALMDQGAWVFLNCAKGQLRDAAYLLGSFLVAGIQAAAMSRADLPEGERRPFTLFVDEFQNFRGEDFETILCEARKYRLRLVLAHQHLGQLEGTLQNAIFGNVATKLFFALSPGDAGIVARELGDGMDRSSRDGGGRAGVGQALETLMRLEVGEALLQRRGQPVVRTRIQRIRTPEVAATELERFTAALRARHGRPLVEIETEIRDRLLETHAVAPAPVAPTVEAQAKPPARSRAKRAAAADPAPPSKSDRNTADRGAKGVQTTTGSAAPESLEAPSGTIREADDA